ncbi:cohesin domain-containing protein [Clostridium arbusti]|uniref:cohesin domain-containing protein n=1 Tax=Clostridium arbusti TaxID=1137848 RepID=UPI000287B2ED|nr:cohesin domain-containing protein [Clostridium arbusti]
MKKIFSSILIFLLLMGNTIVFADTKPSVNIDIKGNIETGQSIQILINVSNIKNLYAGAAKFKYDKNILKVTGFEKGDLISKSGVNVFDAGNNVDNDNGIAEFGGFSCLGQVAGFSGSGTFLIINAQVLKKDNFHIKSVPLLADPNEDNNLKIQLIDNNIKDINYNFTGYDFKVKSESSGTASQPGSGNNGDGSKGSGSAIVDTKNNNSTNASNKDNSVNSKPKDDNSNNTASGKGDENSNSNAVNSVDSKSQDNASSNAPNATDEGSNISNKNDSSKEQSNKDLNEDVTSQSGGNPENNTSSNKIVEAERKINIYTIGIAVAVILALCFIVFKFVLKKKKKDE